MTSNSKHHILSWNGQRLLAAVVVRQPGQAMIEHHDSFDTALPLPEVAKRLNRFIRKHRALREKWVVVAPQSAVLWKWMTVPSQEDNEIAKMIDLAQAGWGLDDGQVVASYAVTARQPDGYARVCVGLIRRELLEKYWDFLQAGGLKNVRWCVSAWAVKNVCELIEHKVLENEAVLLSIESAASEMSWLVNGEIRHAKTLPIGEGRSSDLVPHIVSFYEQSPGPNQKTSPPVIIVSTESIGDLPHTLSARGIPVYVPSVNQENFMGRRLGATPMPQGGLMAIGASLSTDSTWMNWIPPQIRQSAARRRTVREWGKAAFLMTMICFLAVLWGALHYWQKNAQLEDLRRQDRVIKMRLTKMDDLAQELRQIQSKIKRRVFIVDMLGRIDQARGRGLFLNRLEWGLSGGLVLQGVAGSEEDVSAFQKALIDARLFREVNLQYTQRKQDESDAVYFKIRCELNTEGSS